MLEIHGVYPMLNNRCDFIHVKILQGVQKVWNHCLKYLNLAAQIALRFQTFGTPGISLITRMSIDNDINSV